MISYTPKLYQDKFVSHRVLGRLSILPPLKLCLKQILNSVLRYEKTKSDNLLVCIQIIILFQYILFGIYKQEVSFQILCLRTNKKQKMGMGEGEGMNMQNASSVYTYSQSMEKCTGRYLFPEWNKHYNKFLTRLNRSFCV